MLTMNYSMEEFPFCQVVGDIFECHNLMLLHKQQRFEYDMMVPGKDQNTEFHELFYAECELVFLPLYRKFVKTLIGNEECFYQRIPTFRVHLPNNKAVGGESHRDRDYNHPSQEVNFLVPLTSMMGSNSMFVESKDGLRDFRMVTLQPGQYLKFNGANLEHGNVPNTSGWTRISFDFRILRASDMKHLSGKLSVAHGLRFIAGEYYVSSSSL